MDTLILDSILWLQSHISAESLTLWLFAFCALSILILFRFYGAFGLYVYNSLAIVVANIQVLRFTQFEHCSEPMALGTVVFTTTYFVNDVLTEHYGPEIAKKSIWLGFWAQLVATVWMVLALGHPLPLANSSEILNVAHNNYTAMLQLFSPSLRILLASIFAYLVSQWLDILIFNRLRNATAGKFLWLRQNTAMLISGVIDTLLFSWLAFMLLSETQITWYELFFTYMLNSMIMRLILNIAFTPLMYMSYRYVPTKRQVFI